MSKQPHLIHPASYESSSTSVEGENNNNNNNEDDDPHENFDCGKVERLDALEFLLDSSSGLIIVGAIVAYYCSNIINRSENVLLTHLCRWFSNNEYTYNTMTGNVVSVADGSINSTYSTILIVIEIIVAILLIYLLYKFLVERSTKEKLLKCSQRKKNKKK